MVVVVEVVRSWNVTKNGWNLSVIFYGINPSNPLACFGTVRQMLKH